MRLVCLPLTLAALLALPAHAQTAAAPVIPTFHLWYENLYTNTGELKTAEHFWSDAQRVAANAETHAATTNPTVVDKAGAAVTRSAPVATPTGTAGRVPVAQTTAATSAARAVAIAEGAASVLGRAGGWLALGITAYDIWRWLDKSNDSRSPYSVDRQTGVITQPNASGALAGYGWELSGGPYSFAPNLFASPKDACALYIKMKVPEAADWKLDSSGDPKNYGCYFKHKVDAGTQYDWYYRPTGVSAYAVADSTMPDPPPQVVDPRGLSELFKQNPNMAPALQDALFKIGVKEAAKQVPDGIKSGAPLVQTDTGEWVVTKPDQDQRVKTSTVTSTRPATATDPATRTTATTDVTARLNQQTGQPVFKTTTTTTTQPLGQTGEPVGTPTVTTSTTETQAPKADPAPDLCALHPDIIACRTLGEDEPTKVPRTEHRIDIMPVTLPGSGQCPAPLTFEALGQRYELSYQPACDFATAVRPVILLISGVVAAYIFISGLRA